MDIHYGFLLSIWGGGFGELDYKLSEKQRQLLASVIDASDCAEPIDDADDAFETAALI